VSGLPGVTLTPVPSAILLFLVVGAAFAGSALGGLVTAVIFAVAAAALAAFLQIRALGRRKD